MYVYLMVDEQGMYQILTMEMGADLLRRPECGRMAGVVTLFTEGLETEVGGVCLRHQKNISAVLASLYSPSNSVLSVLEVGVS